MHTPLGTEEKKDSQLILFIEKGELPKDDNRARKLSLQESMFVIVDGVLYKVDPKKRSKQVVVPQHLRKQLIDEYHRRKMAGHFSVDRVFKTMALKWWWNGMYKDIDTFVSGCPECTTVSGGGKVRTPPLCPIPVKRPFQIMGVDIMALPKTSKGSQYVLAFQDFLSKWPRVYAIPDQRTHRILKILVEEIVPIFGVPEALLSD